MTQTVEVPLDRRVILEVPHEYPTGSTASFNVVWFPQSEKSNPAVSFKKPDSNENGKIRLTKKEWDELLEDETLLSLTGILHTDMTLDEIREERLAKYL